MDSSILCLPGVFQIRKISCCLACGLKDYGLDSGLICEFMYNGFLVEEIYDPVTQPLVDLMESFPKKKREAIQAMCKSVMEYHAGIRAPLTHRRYYQKDVLEVKHKETLGEITRGQILEIFQLDENCVIAENVIENFKDDFMEVVQPEGVYPYLPNVKFDKYVCLSTSENFISVSSRNSSSINTRLFVQDWDHTPLEIIFHRVEWIVKRLSRISMVIVQDLYSQGSTVPCINQWLKMFTRLFGSLDSMIIVFQLVYTDFVKFDLVKSSDVRKEVNKKVPDFLRGKIIYLDVSPGNDEISGEGAERRLEILPLD